MPKGCPERPPGPWGSQAVSAEGARGLGSQRVPQDLRVCMVVKVRSGSRPPGGAICSAGPAMRPVPGLGLWGTGAGSPGGGRAGATPTSRPWRAAGSLLSSLGLPLEGTFPALTRKARPFLGPPCCPPLWPGCGALWGAQSSVPSRGGRAPPPPHPVPPPATRWGALQQTQLWPLLAGRSAPTLGAHTFPGPSPPDSPSGAAWTPPPPGSPPPVTPGPRTCPAVCVLPQPALLPAALGGGPLGPLLWAFLPLRVAPPSEPCYPALPSSVRPEFYVLWWERVSVGLPGEEQGPPECGVAVPQE